MFNGELDRAIFDAAGGIEAIFNGFLIKVLYEKQVERGSDYGRPAINDYEITVIDDDAVLSRGDNIKTANGLFKVEKVVEADGFVTTYAVNLIG